MESVISHADALIQFLSHDSVSQAIERDLLALGANPSIDRRQVHGEGERRPFVFDLIQAEFTQRILQHGPHRRLARWSLNWMVQCRANFGQTRQRMIVVARRRQALLRSDANTILFHLEQWQSILSPNGSEMSVIQDQIPHLLATETLWVTEFRFHAPES